MQQSMNGTSSSSGPEATPVWKTLGQCLPPRQNDWDYWWKFSGPQMAILLSEAGYSVHEQYEALLFYYHHIIPRLGQAPGPDGKPHWKSPLSTDGSPVEWSFKWNTATTEPDIRYTIECLGDFTGTTADPFNIESTKDLMYRLSLQFPKIDLTWFHQLAAYVFDKEKANYLASGGFPTTTMVLAFELLKTGVMVKAYFIAPKPPPGSTAQIYDVGFWRSAVRMLAPSSMAADTAFSFLGTNFQGQSLHPVSLSIDCIAPSQSRIKLYLQSPDTTFDSVREIMTLGGSITGLDDQLNDLYDLIKSITGLPADHPSSKPVPVTTAYYEDNPKPAGNKTEPLSGYVYYFDIKPGAARPDIKFYIPTRQYAKTDSQVTDGLTAWMNERNRGQYVENYRRMLNGISTHRPLEEGNGLHAFLSCAFMKGETHITSYIGPEAYHLRRLAKGRYPKCDPMDSL